MLQDVELISLFQEGYIPGPNESEEAFLKRIAYNRTLHKELDPEFEQSDRAKELLLESFNVTNRVFGFSLKETPILFSNKKLGLFHGGCAWIFQKEEGGPIGAFFQLRRHFKDHEFFLKIYSRKEILAHEAFHAARMAFEEPRYEEILAYRSSASPFRRKWGALFRSSKELLIILITKKLFLVLILVPIFLSVSTLPEIYLHVAIFILLLLIPTALALRLTWARNRLDKVFKNLQKLTNSGEKADHIVTCLTDDEIDRYALLSEEEVHGVIASRAAHSLRERLILCLLRC